MAIQLDWNLHPMERQFKYSTKGKEIHSEPIGHPPARLAPSPKCVDMAAYRQRRLGRGYADRGRPRTAFTLLRACSARFAGLKDCR